MSYPCVLSVAGSDPTGGAGVECDLRVYQAVGVHGAAVATALTTQTPDSVQGFVIVPHNDIRERIAAVLSSLPITAVRIGMLPTMITAAAIVDVLHDASYEGHLVIDPVIQSTSGHVLASVETIQWLLGEASTKKTVITPNQTEAKSLLGMTLDDSIDATELASQLQSRFGCGVLVTGGDLHGEYSRDFLVTVDSPSVHTMEARRIPIASPHGTGCALASSLAAALAKGHGLPSAAQFAKDFVTKAIERAFSNGGGAFAHRPLLRFTNEIF